MGKIVLVFVLALVAMQGIESAFIKHPKNVINELGKELPEIIRKGNTQMTLFSELLKKAGVLKNKASDPLASVYEIRMLAVQTKSLIAEIIAENNIFHLKKCGHAADKEVLTMEEKAQSAVDEALDDLYAAFKPFEADYLAVMDKYTAVNEKIADVSNRCGIEFPNDQEAFQKCVDDLFESEGINEEIKEVQKITDDLIAVMDKPMNEAGVIYDKIMTDLYLETSNQGNVIIFKHLLKCYGLAP